MPRTNTTALCSFTRPSSVTYHLPDPSVSSNSYSGSNSVRNAPETPTPATTVTIHLPQASSWSSGLHFHSTHTEYLRIVQGHVSVTLIPSTGRITKAYTPADDTIRIDRFVIHEWKRASVNGEEVVVQEWTDPADGAKEVFFRNLNSAILDADMERVGVAKWIPASWWMELQILTICAGMDNYPILVEAWGTWMAMRTLMIVILKTVALLCSFMGFRAWYEEYTPARLISGTEKKDL